MNKEKIHQKKQIHLDLAKGDERRVERRLVDPVRQTADVECGLGSLWSDAGYERGLHR